MYLNIFGIYLIYNIMLSLGVLPGNSVIYIFFFKFFCPIGYYFNILFIAKITRTNLILHRIKFV